MSDRTCLDCSAPLVRTGEHRWPKRCQPCQTTRRMQRNRELALARYEAVKDDPGFRRQAAARTAAWVDANRDRHNASKQRRYVAKQADRVASLGVRQCARCGEAFNPRENRQIYCTSQCMRAVKAAAERARRLEAVREPRECIWCGAPFHLEKRSNTTCCSQQCRNAVNNQRRRFARRAGTDERPILMRFQIAERDDWRCGICRGSIDRALKYPQPMSLSIDHVLPLVHGGTNDMENLQASHLRCNLRKRHSIT
jgi:hypothetical protein